MLLLRQKLSLSVVIAAAAIATVPAIADSLHPHASLSLGAAAVTAHNQGTSASGRDINTTPRDAARALLHRKLGTLLGGNVKITLLMNAAEKHDPEAPELRDLVSNFVHSVRSDPAAMAEVRAALTNWQSAPGVARTILNAISIAMPPANSPSLTTYGSIGQ